MKFAFFFIFSAFFVFHVKSDSISEFKAVVDETTQNLADCDENLHNWIVLTLSDLKDTSTGALAESWMATFNFSDILEKKSKTNEEKDCLKSENNKLKKIVEETSFKLHDCFSNSSKMAEPLRKRIQETHEICRQIQSDLDNVKKTCGSNTDKPEEECIALKISEFNVSLGKAQELLPLLNIQTGTIKPIILSDAMHCNEQILKNVHESVLTIQNEFINCVKFV